MLTNNKTKLACAIVSAALAASQVFAATRHVDPNDPAAFPTIQKAIDAARAFDTVVVHPGVYKENIDFRAKLVTVCSTDPNDPDVVARTIVHAASGNAPTVIFRFAETEYSTLDGLTIQNGTSGVECVSPAAPTIRRCVITQNSSGVRGGKPAVVDCIITRNGAYGVRESNATLVGCVVSGNEVGIFSSSSVNLTNCTIVGNERQGVFCIAGGAVRVFVSNSIVAYNLGGGLYYGAVGSNPPFSEYTNVYGNPGGDYCYVAAGKHDVSVPPHFADNGFWDAATVWWQQGDYHLMSKVGRWDPVAKGWVKDPIDSPCIDKGDPNTPVGDEPYPNGGRVNLGAYGGTAEASKSEGGCREYPPMDFNKDCKVDQADLDLFLEHWLECGLDDPNACWPQGPPAAPEVRL
jgi:hypothetical protein